MHKVFFSLLFLVAFFSGCGQTDTIFDIPTTDKTIPALSFRSRNGSAPAEMTLEESEPVAPVYWFAAQAEAGKGKPDFSFPFPLASSNGDKPLAKTRRIVVKTAPAFGPPSPVEKAAGWSVGGLTLAAVAALALAGLLAYGQHYKAAGFAGAGAGVSLVAAKFMSDDNALLILGAFAVFAVALFFAWHFVRDKIPAEFGGNAKGRK